MFERFLRIEVTDRRPVRCRRLSRSRTHRCSSGQDRFRGARPGELYESAVASDDAAVVHGVRLDVDGGRTATAVIAGPRPSGWAAVPGQTLLNVAGRGEVARRLDTGPKCPQASST